MRSVTVLFIVLVLAGSCFTATANAELAITEIMSQSAHSGTGGDWWELTNTGSSLVNLTGYSWDDDHQRIGQNIFGAVTIAPGESIIIIDELHDGSVEEWKLDWSLGAEAGVYGRDYFSFIFSALGSADGIFLYNTDDELVTSVTYPSRTTGISNEWDTSGTFLGLSVIGENGAYQSLNIVPDVASPGYAVVVEVEPCIGGSGRMLYWTDKDSARIQRLNLDNDCVEDILTAGDGLVNPRGFAIDTSSGKMYWSDGDAGLICRANLDGSGDEQLLTGLSFPTDLALDMDNGKIYFSETGLSRIRKVNIDGTGPIEDVISGLGTPYYLTLDLTNSRIYWSDVNNTVIRRANMDGTGIVDFITGLTYVRDMVLDLPANKIYWGDRGSSTVQRANLNDGSGIEVLYGPADGLDRPHGLLLDDTADWIYWTDTVTSAVHRGNTDGSSPVEDLVAGLNGPWALAMVTITRVIYVDADRPPGGDGTSWDTAYKYLADGLDAAANGDQIWVAEGTYKPTELIDPNDPRTATFQMKNGVTIYGGFPDTGNPDWGDRDPNQYETILSGDIGTMNDPNDNCYHVFYHPDGLALDPNAILDGFTITAGNADGLYPYNPLGGGILNYEYSNPTVTNCKFVDNLAILGGGMYNYLSNPTVTDCTFSGNSAFNGGGMMNWFGDPTVKGSTFTGNLAAGGGGMCNDYASSPTVTDCTFIGNSATYGGGGMANVEDSRPTVNNCTFSGNLSDSSYGDGGGMINLGSSPTVISCTFTANSARFGGGMCNWDASSPTVTNCTFTGNSAGWGGGGGMRNSSSSPTVSNCILWGNTATDFANEISGTASVSYCCVQGGYTGTGNIDTDPLFADPNNGDYHLKSAGWRWDPHACASCDLTDDGIVNLADFAWLVNSWLNSGPSIPADINKDQTVDLDDLYLFAQQYLTPGYETGQWTWDDVTSRCIDAGNPGALLGNEPMTLDVDPLNHGGQNLRINMGAYGGTAEASMPPYDWALLADLTNDGIVNLADFANQGQDWQQIQIDQPGDLNRDGTVDLNDALLMANDWLHTTTWH